MSGPMCNHALKGPGPMNREDTPRQADGAPRRATAVHHPNRDDDDPPATHSPARLLADLDLTLFLDDYRVRNARAAGVFDAAIVELELEAMRRGLQLDGPTEQTPPELALDRCRHWLQRGHVDAVAACMWDLAPLGLWQVYLLVRAVEVNGARMFLLQCLLHVVDTLRLGSECAAGRGESLDRSGMDYAGIEAYLCACLDAHFHDWMLFRGPVLPGEGGYES
jgi:hypothetical protein